MSESHPETDAFADAGSETGEDLFLKLLEKDAEEPSEEERDEDEHDTTSDEDESDEDAEEPSEDGEDEDEGQDESDEDETPAKKKGKVELSDDYEFEHPVNGQVKKFTIAQAKRVLGQEAALTQRSMELAETKKIADETVTTYAASLNYLYEKAKAKADQYTDTNLLLWSKDMPEPELKKLVEEAKIAKQDKEYFEKEISTVSRRLQAESAQRLRVEGQRCTEILQGPVEQGGIEGFDQKRYEDLMGFAVKAGIPAQTVHTLVDPGAWRIIDMAYRYARGTKTLETKTSPVKPAKPGRVVKSTPTAAVQSVTKDKQAMRNLRATGDVDAAADVFLSRLSRK
jgi:hypothetical protein